ncbi:MAG: hypothetical protein IPJ98_08415 [Bryobacterales bacterium]|nr:hypothetical protein [Bryobacterales bacterium]
MSLEEQSALHDAVPAGEEEARGEADGAEPQQEERESTAHRELIREEIARALERWKTPEAEPQRSAEESGESIESLKQALAASREEAAGLKAEASRLRKDQYLRQALSALGVENLELAVKAVREDIVEAGGQKWVAPGEGGDVPAQEYLAEFLKKNRELLPARRLQGGGMPASRVESGGSVDLEEIRPGMDPVTLKKVRDAIGRAMGVFPRGS